MITISEIQAGSLQTNRKRQDFRVLVEKAVKNWRNQMESKGIQLSVNMPDAPLFISAEKSQLGWAVESLLSNAHNYTPANGGSNGHGAGRTEKRPAGSKGQRYWHCGRRSGAVI
ncbi:MAG: hypothetical protein M5U34_11730 [Chloroflexi bacterium]|nr:hypothetical protein [Chloroflexota bacterium]